MRRQRAKAGVSAAVLQKGHEDVGRRGIIAETERQGRRGPDLHRFSRRGQHPGQFRTGVGIMEQSKPHRGEGPHPRKLRGIPENQGESETG